MHKEKQHSNSNNNKTKNNRTDGHFKANKLMMWDFMSSDVELAYYRQSQQAEDVADILLLLGTKLTS